MIRTALRLHCGHTVTIRVKDDAELAARKAQSDLEHADGGPGCYLCRPTYHPPQPPEDYGSSLLDRAPDSDKPTT